MNRVAAVIVLIAALLVLFLAMHPAEGQDSPHVAMFWIQGRPVVCMRQPDWKPDAEQWEAMCAPVGPWMACVETPKTLACGGRPI